MASVGLGMQKNLDLMNYFGIKNNVQTLSFVSNKKDDNIIRCG